MDEFPRTIHFLLLPDFPLYAVVPATDALRIANQNAGCTLYDWQYVSAAGGAVRSSSGMAIDGTGTIGAGPAPDCVIVCSGNEPTQHLDRRVLAWLRRLGAHGVVLGALDTGTFALAAAGVVRDRTVTLHWEAIPVFQDAFPSIKVTNQIFVLDRDMFTAAGGVASLDLMLALIARAHGSRLAQVVANAFIHQRPRPAETPQRIDAVAGPDERTLFRRAVELMVDNVLFPLGIEELCAHLNVSRRSLERTFLKQASRSPAAYYLDVRLQIAREQLFYSSNKIAHIAEVTGFQSDAHFCRAFRTRFEQSPTMMRRAFQSDQRMRYYPTGTTLIGPSS